MKPVAGSELAIRLVVDDITRHGGFVSREDRERVLRQKGAVVWLTGLPASGKSTIAYALELRLVEAGRLAYVLDGDNLRHGLCAGLSFSPEDRMENIRRAGEVAGLFADAGVIVIAAFISPYREDRERARHAAPAGRFMEVYMNVPLEVCESRDPKGLYRKARAGQISGFTGIDAPYEPPEYPDLALATHEQTVEQAVDKIGELLRDRRII